MFITCSGIQKGFIADKYGKYGTEFNGSIPSYSLGFKINDVPKGSVSFAFILDDPDAVSGFNWIHWLGANLLQKEIPDNVSISFPPFIQGKNSWGIVGYGGMAPPDKPHTYVLRVFALDCLLNLKNGFTLEEMNNQTSGHILDSAFIEGIYRH